MEFCDRIGVKLVKERVIFLLFWIFTLSILCHGSNFSTHLFTLLVNSRSFVNNICPPPPFHTEVNNRRSKQLFVYSSGELKILRKQHVAVSNKTLLTLSTLGLRKTCQCPFKSESTKRGKRGGKRKQRPIETIITNMQTRKLAKNAPPVNRPPSCAKTIDCRLYCPAPDSKFYKTFLLNAQSVRNKTDDISDLILDLNTDIAFLTETWLTDSKDDVVMSKLTPKGYTLSSVPRQSGRGGGLAVLCKSYLSNITKIKALDSFRSFEALECVVNLHSKNVTFVCLYRPPPNKKNKLTTKQFLEEFSDLLDRFTSYTDHLIILGDFNLHYDNSGNKDIISMKDTLCNHNLVQLVNAPTHHHQHVLDWVIMKENSNIVNNVVAIDKAISDHFVVTFDVHVRKPPQQKRVISSRNLKTIDHDSFRQDLLAVRDNILNSNTKNDKVDAYNETMTTLLDDHAPLKSRTITDRPSAPWMTLEIKAAKQERRQAERKFRKTSLSIYREIFHSLHVKVKNLIKSAKSFWINNSINKCPSSKSLYAFTNKLCKKGNNNIYPLTVPRAQVAERFCNFFTEKISKIRNSLKSSECADFVVPTFSGNALFNFKSVSENEIKNIILQSPSKTCSLDPLPTPLVREHIDCFVPIFTTIVNDSLKSGTFPCTLKHAIWHFYQKSWKELFYLS